MNNNNQIYNEAVKALANSMQYMISQALKDNTQIYNGVIASVSSGNYTITVNGQNYIIKQYGNIEHAVGDFVKVFIPQGNMNIAFFM